MPRVFAALILLCLASSAAGQGLVQITLGGRLDSRGGGRVEVEVGALDVDGQARRVDLSVHLAEKTTGVDLAGLLARRLERGGFTVIAPPPDANGNGNAHVFVESALFVNARLGNGLGATVTVCEGAPDSLRILKPETIEANAELTATVTTTQLHTGHNSQHTLGLVLTPELHEAQISDQLFKVSIEHKWIAERPGTDSWRPMRMADGSELRGFSVTLKSAGDWRLEVELASAR